MNICGKASDDKKFARKEVRSLHQGFIEWFLEQAN